MKTNLLKDLKMYYRFCFGLRKFLKEKFTFEDARQIVKNRMQHREENFLKILRKGIFEYRKSPYLPLFKLSHCEYNDVSRMVSKSGIEQTLKTLKEDGVYFRIQEFKGKESVSRKGLKFIIKERDFDNPYSLGSYETRSGGTRGAGTRVAVDFDYFSQVAANKGLMLDVWGVADFPLMILLPAFPFASGMKIMLTLSKFGIYPIKYISPLEAKRLSFRNMLGVSYIINMGNLFGAKFLKPEFIDYKNIATIVEIIDRLRKEHKRCLVATNASFAVRVCLAAKAKGVCLEGVVFRGGGEPLTPERLKVIEESGAKYILSYSFSEAGGAVGFMCSKPAALDDIHLFKDFITLVSYKKEILDLSFDAFLVTTLLPSSPKILLNVENGDYGVIEDRVCGCSWDDLGYNTHVHGIRSFEKLTGEGMTFYGADFIRITEELLPAKFGGSPLQYQITEEANESGIVQLAILVDPAIGPIDEDELIRTILNELKKGGNDSQTMMADVWERLGMLKVKRSPPFLTKKGKLYPFYINPRRPK